MMNVNCDGRIWQVTGHTRNELGGIEDFHYVTPNVVLATGGSDLPNLINVAGEQYPFVIKSLHMMEQLITTKKLSSGSDPILIVGAGLSAADAIIAAHFHGIPIIHAFRRKADDPSLIFRQLPCNMYPEYHKVYQMMKDNGRTYSGYVPLEEHQVLFKNFIFIFLNSHLNSFTYKKQTLNRSNLKFKSIDQIYLHVCMIRSSMN